MGNTVRALQGRSEDENIEVFKRVVGKYEEIRSRSQLSFLSGGSPSQVNIARLSELQVYKELEQELLRVLGLASPSSSPSLPDNRSDFSSAAGLVVGGGRRTTGKEETGSTPRVGFSLERQSSEVNPSTGGNAASIPKSQGVGTDVTASAAGLALGGGRKRASILVVDDSPISCKLAKRGLGQYNFRVEIALDGRRGLDILFSRPLDFDLVLLDIVMPGLDGIEVLRCMKNHSLLRSIAVVMLSGLQDEMLEEVCVQNGAVAVLKKPIKVDDVLRVVPINCRRRKSSTSLSSRSKGTSPSSPSPIPTKQTKAAGEKSGGEAILEHGGVPKTSPAPTPMKSTEKLMPGQEALSFNLLDSHKNIFRLDEFLARSPNRKLLLAFFPAAFTEAFSGEESEETGSVRLVRLTSSGEESPTGAVPGTESVLSVLMANIAAIKATDTAVVGICKDLPYTLSALSAEKGLDFPVLSDPFLAVSEQFVGTFDLGMFFPSAFGCRSPSPTTHRGAHTGIVVLDGRRKCLYRWLSVDENGNPILPAVVDLPELMISLEGTGFWADSPTNQSAGMGADASRSESGTLQGLENTSRKVVILIVDDSTISFKLATRKLRALGYATLLAENGKAALETLRRRRNQIDLVLLDIVMPIMNGVEFLNIVKNDPDLQRTPVVIVSSVDREQLGRACMEAGALAVLQKPFKAHEVQDLMTREGIA